MSASAELLSREYQGVRRISGPLLFVERASDLPYNALVHVHTPDGGLLNGQVIEVSEETAVIQVFEETTGLDVVSTAISLVDRQARLAVSEDLIGRVFNGAGRPLDGGQPVVPEDRLPVAGIPINPVSRARPRDYVHTGISAIDGFNTLVRGQKLPIFSGAGLPGNEIAARILQQARVTGEDAHFVVVFAAIGVTQRERAFFLSEFEASGAGSRTLMFLNLADDPTIERLLTPRYALTAAEYLAFSQGLRGPGAAHRHDQLLRGAAGDRDRARGDPRPPRLPRLHVHRPREPLRARGPDPGAQGVGDAAAHSVDAGRRHHAPDPGPDGVHHRGPDRALAGAPQARHLPADRRAAVALAPDEQRHRPGPDPRGPSPAGQPALRLLC